MFSVSSGIWRYTCRYCSGQETGLQVNITQSDAMIVSLNVEVPCFGNNWVVEFFFFLSNSIVLFYASIRMCVMLNVFFRIYSKIIVLEIILLNRPNSALAHTQCGFRQHVVPCGNSRWAVTGWRRRRLELLAAPYLSHTMTYFGEKGGWFAERERERESHWKRTKCWSETGSWHAVKKP